MSGVARRDLADLTHAGAAWSGLRVLVAGLGVSGFAAAVALGERGADVIAVDAGDPATTPALAERAAILDMLGVDVRFGPDHVAGLPEADASMPVDRPDDRPDDRPVDRSVDPPLDLVVTSPGWRPDHAVLTAATRAGVPVWGEVELAWRLRPATGAAPWLTVTGTNGKTTTVRMLAGMLRAAGLRATSAGNVGTALVDAVLDPEPYDVLAVELSSFQLHWTSSVRPLASACLNVAPDHVDWHGSFDDYVAAKGKVYEGTEVACVYNVADPVTERLVREAEVQEGCRAVGVTLGVPAPSMLGVVDGVLADRAFVDDRRHRAAELGTVDDLRQEADLAPPPHLVANALAAAALARACGVPPAAVRDGLRGFRPDPHRIAEVARVGGVRFVDDSKATNPHAARASLESFDDVVWIAGGLLKGADVDDLVAAVAARLRGVVLIGTDRGRIARALGRHAPDVPVVDVATLDTEGMDLAVRRAAELARPGHVVLLAPAAASMDMFTDYGARGDAFAAAVAEVARLREA